MLPTAVFQNFTILHHPFVQEDDIAKAFEKIREQHGAVVNSKEVTWAEQLSMECFAGEGDGAGQGQEARAGVQDGSAMQVEILIGKL